MKTINVYCRSGGWLFDDFKHHYQKSQEKKLYGDKVRVIVTDHPVSASAWVCIRTNEARYSPCLERTVVQRHDYFRQQPETVMAMARAAHVVYANPHYRDADESHGFVNRNVRTAYCQHIGVRRKFLEGRKMKQPDGRIVGVGGREYLREGVELKRSTLVNRALAIAAAHGPNIVYNIGGKFPVHAGTVEPNRVREVRVKPSNYDDLSCYVTASVSPAIPLGMFEAVARGVPVVSTFRDVPEFMRCRVVFTSPIPSHMGEAIAQAAELPRLLPEAKGFPLQEDWLDHSIALAQRVAEQP